MKPWSIPLLGISLGLAGCATTPKLPSADVQFSEIVKSITTSDTLPSYSSAWNAYLKSSQAQSTGPKYQLYLQAVAQVEAGNVPCISVDWENISNSNFWSIKPHMTAAACYEQHGDAMRAAWHNRAVDFLLKGILASGNGEDYYSAYEIASLGDAHDVIELMGFDIVDYYGDFFAARKAFYYVVVANDPKTGKQHEIHFDNQRFVHAIMGTQYPFLGVDDGWKLRVLPSLEGQGRAIKVPLAGAEAADGKYERAYQLYMEAIADDSLRARYRLALLGIQGKIPQVTPQQSVQLLLEAADKQYVPAIVVLSYLYDKGIVVEKDKELAEQLVETISNRKEPGYVYYSLAQHFANGLLAEPDKQSAHNYYKLAAQAGNVDAKLVLLFKKLEQDKDKKEQSAQKKDVLAEHTAELAELKAIAEGGSKWANYVVGTWLMEAYPSGSAEYNEAESWLIKAAKFGIPAAYNSLGLAYQEGKFGEKNETKALNNFIEGALRFYPDAILSVGYYNDMGIVVHTNKQNAARWYAMCYGMGNVICTANLGRMFVHGDGVTQNFKFARELFESAARANHAGAFNELGNIFLNGRGTEKDVTKAIENYAKAAELGNDYGHYNLGQLYMNGIDVPKDLEKARQHFVQAEHHPSAKKRLAEIDAFLGKAGE